MLEALAWGRGRYRGVALLSGHERDAELADMAAVGVRGVRLNFLRISAARPIWRSPAGWWSRAGELGWHVQLHFDASGLIRFDDFIRSIEIPVA